ncbi:unnamed protein product [Microthlaspi erraticum]|uniref:Uncharacterized protein n=1 Tax=Microthlaspi erraticum TaxID=1685480 RepID=A0A6D2HNC3_9BRAS|nr:unnamed protein product [Microthlaspi erraticum]
MDHEDQIDLILEGLPDEYKPIVDQVEGRDTPPSIIELHERLLNHEAKLLSNGLTPSFPAFGNVAQQRSSSNNYNCSGRNQNRNNHQHSNGDAAWPSSPSAPRPN